MKSKTIFILSLFLSGCIVIPKYVSSPKISGKIINQETGEPVPKALICLLWDKEEMIFGMHEKEEYDSGYTFTDEFGCFRIPAVKNIASTKITTLGKIDAPEATLLITKTGYAPQAFLLKRKPPPKEIQLYPNNKVEIEAELLKRLSTGKAFGENDKTSLKMLKQ